MNDNVKSQEMIGLPVEEFYKRSGPSQLTDSVKGPELGHMIKALATDPNVTAFGWHQYTPFFNDGDVCEFRAGDLWVQTVLDTVIDGSWDLEVGSSHPTLGDKKGEYYENGEKDWRGQPRQSYRWVPKEAKFPLTRELAEGLNQAISRAEVTLLDWFGDHVEIKVTAGGVEVSEYEHD